jgi:uncharacterized protein
MAGCRARRKPLLCRFTETPFGPHASVTASLKIAIVGSGIAGLSAAWLLGRRHAVTLYERHPRPGMGAFNVDSGHGDPPVRIDLPLRVFKSGYYDTLMALYAAAGVEMQPTDHAAAFATPQGETYFRYRNLRFGGRSIPLPSGLGWRRLGIAREALRLVFSAPRDLARGVAQGLSLDEYLRQRGYGADFVNGMLLPSFAAICTCSYEAVRRYPAEVIIGFFSSGSLFSGTWRARHGADDAIRRLLQPCGELRNNTAVTAVEPGSAGLRVVEADGRSDRFDHVVLAVQAHQAAVLAQPAEPQAAALLARVPHESSEVVVHGDGALVPDSVGDAPVHFQVDPTASRPMASIRLNRIIPELAGRQALFQTWNPLVEPHRASVLGRAHFERPVVDLDSQAAMTQLVAMQRADGRRLWFCGSYLMPGIPLLESAAQSAVQVAERLGVAAPWKPQAPAPE